MYMIVHVIITFYNLVYTDLDIGKIKYTNSEGYNKSWISYSEV